MPRTLDVECGSGRKWHSIVGGCLRPRAWRNGPAHSRGEPTDRRYGQAVLYYPSPLGSAHTRVHAGSTVTWRHHEMPRIKVMAASTRYTPETSIKRNNVVMGHWDYALRRLKDHRKGRVSWLFHSTTSIYYCPTSTN